MAKLAINGGNPVRTKPFPSYVSTGPEEAATVARVLASGSLSSYLAAAGQFFEGGPWVRRLEKEWARAFKIKHAVAMNSATSCLYSAMGAGGVGPGDEVIVSPYTMVASATCAVVFNAVPVFADIDPDTFCISPATIAPLINKRTKAIVAVDILGHPADMAGIMELAIQHNLMVVEDAAQAYGASQNGKTCGTLGHMGVFSLNYHKTIQCGEGGIVVTDDDDIAMRLKLIRNHGEVVAGDLELNEIEDIVGFNFRMPEIEAAITLEQLKKLPNLVEKRIAAANYLSKELGGLPGLTIPKVEPGCVHGYYLYAMKHDAVGTGVSRDKVVEALNAEGIFFNSGYTKPIYLNPMFQQKVAYGSVNCPFLCPHYKGSANYSKGACLVCERMYYEELFCTNVCNAATSKADLDDVVTAVNKVYENLDELR